MQNNLFRVMETETFFEMIQGKRNFKQEITDSSNNLISNHQQGMKDLKSLQGSVIDSIGMAHAQNTVNMIMHVSNVQEPTAPVFVEKVKNLQSKAHFSNPIQSSLLPTPVKFEVLHKYLEGFDEKKREILTTGFRI